ncbi:MAG: hypothetical protein AAGI53_09325 [Planctomycetota bacterium]
MSSANAKHDSAGLGNEPLRRQPRRRKPHPLDLTAFFAALAAFVLSSATLPRNPGLSGEAVAVDSHDNGSADDQRRASEAVGEFLGEVAIEFASTVKDRVKEKITEKIQSEGEADLEAGSESDLGSDVEAEPDTIVTDAHASSEPNADASTEQTARAQAEPPTEPRSVSTELIAGAVAIGLAGMAFAYGRNRALALSAAGLGVAAILMQMLWIVATMLAIIAFCVLLAPVHALTTTTPGRA